jgi:hypothetical protein
LSYHSFLFYILFFLSRITPYSLFRFGGNPENVDGRSAPPLYLHLAQETHNTVEGGRNLHPCPTIFRTNDIYVLNFFVATLIGHFLNQDSEIFMPHDRHISVGDMDKRTGPYRLHAQNKSDLNATQLS